MDHWRGQAGLEFETPTVFRHDRAAQYVAADTSFFQEDEWKRSASGSNFEVADVLRGS